MKLVSCYSRECMKPANTSESLLRRTVWAVPSPTTFSPSPGTASAARTPTPDTLTFGVLSAVEKAVMVEGIEPATQAMARELQYAAWQEHRINTQPWLVTDLVTLGSPLTHGNLLLADKPAEFPGMRRERMLPTCPPPPPSEPGSQGSTESATHSRTAPRMGPVETRSSSRTMELSSP